MSLDLPSPDLLHKILRYDPDTGRFYWKRRDVQMFRSFDNDVDAFRKFNKTKSGRRALTTLSSGYLIGRLWLHPYKDRAFYAHRVAWVMMTNEPIAALDTVKHMNAKRDDNRFSNLRLVRGGQS